MKCLLNNAKLQLQSYKAKTIMTKNLFITTFLITVLTVPALYAQTSDDNIIIENKIENYTYKISSKRVFLEEKTTTNYHCLKWLEKIIVTEFYDLYSTIDMVDIKAEKKISPIYEPLHTDIQLEIKRG